MGAGRTFEREVWIVVLADLETGVETAVWLVHAALVAKLENAGPQVGELVAIRYEGQTTPRGGGDPYHAYRVAVDRGAAGRVDWAAVSAGPGSAPAFLPAAAAGELEPAVGGPTGSAAAPTELEQPAPTPIKAARPTVEGGDRRGEGAPASFGETPSGRQPSLLDRERQPPPSCAPPLETDARPTFAPCDECAQPWPGHEPGCSHEFGGL